MSPRSALLGTDADQAIGAALKCNLDHLRLSPEARKRGHVNYYQAEHMMYVHPDSG